MGRSCGGLSTKIHMVVNGMGKPVRFLVTGGQVSDYKGGEILLQNIHAQYVLADKGYDSNYLVRLVKGQGAKAVIPPKRNRKVKRRYDKTVYKQRNWVERSFNKLKDFRRIATRYDRRAMYYASFVALAAAILWG